MEKELIIHKEPKSPIAEIFRTLRTNIQFMTANKGLKTLLVTSSVPGEGKSWVSSNLILAFAQEGKKVLIVDSDMRKGRLHQIFEIEKKPGLSNYLSGVSELEDKDNIFLYIKNTNIDNLYVLPAGDVPPNPSELLGTDRMTDLISILKNTFDVVVFDGTPCLLVADSMILARQLDATVIVTAYKSTKMSDVEKIQKMVENVGGKIAGVVINKIPVSAKKYESTYYYGKSEKENENSDVNKEEKQDKKIDEEKVNIEEIDEQIMQEIEEFKSKEESEKKKRKKSK